MHHDKHGNIALDNVSTKTRKEVVNKFLSHYKFTASAWSVL